jgi:hypothetical protein
VGDKPIFARPIEIVTGTNDVIKCRTTGGGGYTSFTLTAGVYPSVFGVIWQFYRSLNSTFANTWTIEDGADTDGRYLYNKIVFGSSHDILIDQQATARMLGWQNDTSTAESGTTISFSYQPEYIWVPRMQVANQGRFYRNLDEEFSGKQTKTGTLAGNSTGPTVYYRDLEFQNEKAFNLYEEGATKELYYDGSHVTKNFQYFTNQSMTSSPSVAGNPSTRGFWYIPDWNDILGTVSTSNQGPDMGTLGDIGIRFDLTSNADKWEFCQFSAGGAEPPTDTGVPTGRELYHQANITIHTSDYPTFLETGA